MAETIGTITNIKVRTFFPGATNEFDFATITMLETSTGISWLFYLWNSNDNDLPVHRVTASQRLALAREAAVQKLTVHIFADSAASVLYGIQVDLP
jgi:hypothetical protein